MSDFHQSGEIATLHQLGPRDRPRLEEELMRFSSARPLALILPVMAADMDGPALPRIVEELGGAAYVSQVVVALGGGARKDLEKAREFFGGLPQQVSIVFEGGRAMSKLLAELKDHGVSIGREGKGRSIWLALGVILGGGKSRCVAMHDCDIQEYDRLLLGRLAYPVMNSDLDYKFCKGYYARVTHRMFGRVTRLFVTPLLKALISLVGPVPYLCFLDSFRYALAGECAMDLDSARLSRMPADWGLEVGLLGEAFRNQGPKRVCQVDLAENYEHKHQDLSHNDPGKGLQKMCTEIGLALLRGLAAEGVELSAGILRSLAAAYVRRAEDLITCYEADAAVNGLVFDRHGEETAVRTFAQGLNRAMTSLMEDPLGQSVLSNWSWVMSAAPDFPQRLAAMVEADSA